MGAKLAEPGAHRSTDLERGDHGLMTPRRPLSELHAALEQFGRRARKLSAARLEEFDMVLEAVGTPDQLADPDRRHDFAVRVDAALRSIVDSIDDSVDRRIAQAVLASEPEFFDKTVTARRQYVAEKDLGFTDDQFKTRRRRILGDIAAALAAAFLQDRGINESLSRLTVEARRAGRQLFWAVQHAVAYVEAFDYTCRVIEYLEPEGQYRRHAIQIVEQRTVHHDAALWWLTQAHHHLRTMQADETGRDFITEHLPAGWSDTNIRMPFLDYEVSAMRTAYLSSPVHEPYPFVEQLRREPAGRSTYARWLRTLSTLDNVDDLQAREFARYRHELLTRLIELADLLLASFPTDRRAPEEIGTLSTRISTDLILLGPTDTGAPFDDAEAHEVFRAQKRALQDGPALWSTQYLLK